MQDTKKELTGLLFVHPTNNRFDIYYYVSDEHALVLNQNMCLKKDIGKWIGMISYQNFTINGENISSMNYRITDKPKSNGYSLDLLINYKFFYTFDFNLQQDAMSFFLKDSIKENIAITELEVMNYNLSTCRVNTILPSHFPIIKNKFTIFQNNAEAIICTFQQDFYSDATKFDDIWYISDRYYKVKCGTVKINFDKENVYGMDIDLEYCDVVGYGTPLTIKVGFLGSPGKFNFTLDLTKAIRVGDSKFQLTLPLDIDPDHHLKNLEVIAYHTFESGFYNESFIKIYEGTTGNTFSQIPKENQDKILKHLFDARNKYIGTSMSNLRKGVYSMENALSDAAKEINLILTKKSRIEVVIISYYLDKYPEAKDKIWKELETVYDSTICEGIDKLDTALRQTASKLSGQLYDEKNKKETKVVEVIKQSVQQKHTECQLLLLEQSKLFSTKLSEFVKDKDLDEIKRYLDNFKKLLVSEFGEDETRSIIKNIKESINPAIKDKMQILLNKGWFDSYILWLEFYKN